MLEAAGSYIAGVVSGFALAIMREVLSDATKRREAASHVISTYSRMRERLASDAVADLDGDITTLAKYQSYFYPVHRITIDIAFLRQTYDYARQDWRELSHEAVGRRRERIAAYMRELELQERNRTVDYYLGRAPFYKPL